MRFWEPISKGTLLPYRLPSTAPPPPPVDTTTHSSHPLLSTLCIPKYHNIELCTPNSQVSPRPFIPGLKWSCIPTKQHLGVSEMGAFSRPPIKYSISWKKKRHPSKRSTPCSSVISLLWEKCYKQIVSLLEYSTFLGVFGLHLRNDTIQGSVRKIRYVTVPYTVDTIR